MEYVKINKRTFRAYLKKLLRDGITTIKAELVYEFDGRVDGLVYKHAIKQIPVEKIIEELEYRTTIEYNLEKDRIEVFNSVVAYNIIDERFDELKKWIKKKYVINSI